MLSPGLLSHSLSCIHITKFHAFATQRRREAGSLEGRAPGEIWAVFLDGLEDDVISRSDCVCGEGPSILLKMESGVDLGQSPEGPLP